MVVAHEEFSVFIQDIHFFYGLGKRNHIITQPYNPRSERRSFVRLSFRPVFIVFSFGPTLQLTAPYASKVHIMLSVTVFEDGGIDAIASFNRLGLGFEWASR